MKTWYMNGSTGLILDTETEELITPQELYTNIRSCFIAPCDCTIKYKDSKDSDFLTKEVKKDQVVLLFYRGSLPEPVIVLDSEEFLSNLKAYNDIVQKEKEEWAASKCNECGDICEPKAKNV